MGAGADEDGQEPNRWDRVTAYMLAQRLVDRPSGTVLLFNGMKDMIGAARPSNDGYFSVRDGSKVFVNRLLETNPAPTVWTTNAIGSDFRANGRGAISIGRFAAHQYEPNLPLGLFDAGKGNGQCCCGAGSSRRRRFSANG